MTSRSATAGTGILRLRVWLWKLRYGWYVYTHTRAHDDWIGGYLKWCVTECAQAGWEVAVDDAGSIKAALATNPTEEALNEIECWTDG